MDPFWIILSIPCGLLLVALIFITLNRYISYKERVALVQLGFSLEDLHRDAATKRGNRGVLWGGVITAMSGLALLLGLSTLGLGAWLLGGLLPLFVGLGMILIYFMTAGPAVERVRSDPPDVAAAVAADADVSPFEAAADSRQGDDLAVQQDADE